MCDFINFLCSPEWHHVVVLYNFIIDIVLITQPVAVAVGPSDVGSTGADAVDIETDTPGRLGDQGALLQGVINTFNTVTSHGQEEAGTQLGSRSGGVEQGGGGVSEQLL